MTKHIHVHLHDAAGIQTKKSSDGVTTWGGIDPKQSVPKPKTEDAGTSEGARKAAQTRKAHGGGGAQAQTPYLHPGAARILKSDAPDHLKVMRLQNLALRTMPSSPAQKSIQEAAKKLQGNNPNWHPGMPTTMK